MASVIVKSQLLICGSALVFGLFFFQTTSLVQSQPLFAGEGCRYDVVNDVALLREEHRKLVEENQDLKQEIKKLWDKVDEMQAQTLYAVVYRTGKQIPIPQNYGETKYPMDIAYTGKGSVALSVINTTTGTSSVRRGDGDVSWISNYGSYIQEDKAKVLMYSTRDSLFCQQVFIGHKILYNPKFMFKKEGYTLNGIAICKSGAILVCLWNHAFGKNSQGLVVKLCNGDTLFEAESDKNRKLFTCPTYITENGNGDICVSDVGAVVVTDNGGLLKFRYEGLPGYHHFDPYGICCDSECNIIIADMKNDKIHKINQNGEFLHYIQYDGMKMPRALCIDENDNLYVGEWNCDVIKVISRD